jgi:hypothetical protein
MPSFFMEAEPLHEALPLHGVGGIARGMQGRIAVDHAERRRSTAVRVRARGHREKRHRAVLPIAGIQLVHLAMRQPEQHAAGPGAGRAEQHRLRPEPHDMVRDERRPRVARHHAPGGQQPGIHEEAVEEDVEGVLGGHRQTSTSPSR